jgi:hypothetical protein
MTTHPPIIIPPALKPLAEHKRWLIWRWEQKDNGEWTKVPYQGHATSRKADTTNPKHWCYVKSAMLAYAEGRCDGVGYVLTDGDISAIDIDDCRDAATGDLHAWADEQVTRSKSYVEITPSNEGVRIIGLSNGGTSLNNRYAVPNTNVTGELFRRPPGRYITITGNQIGAATELVNIDAHIDTLVPFLISEPDRGGERPKQAGKFGAVNERALANLGAWVPQLFPTAKRTRAGGYRVKSADLGRGREEDLSFTPKGIKYFGDADMGDPRQGRRTPVEVIIEFQHVEAPQAAEWLGKVLTSKGNGAATPEPPKPETPTEGVTDADVEIARLAKLSALQYEQERKAAAEKLDVRASILDKLVQAERERLGLGGDDGKQGHAIAFPEPELWTEPVNGAALLNGIAAAIRRHVVLPKSAYHTAALWALHTYLIDRFLVSPRLGIRSPTKGCGKTLLLDVLGRLVARPLPTASVTPAAIFRVVEAHRPTLLIDEADTFLYDNDELRGVLNGNRKGSTVLRTVGDDHEPRAFSTYSAAAIALIGALPDTLHDRSVPVELKRRLAKEKVEPFRPDRADHLDELARKAARWAKDHADGVSEADPAMPDGVINRLADNWRPLLAIADMANGRWPKRARAAARRGYGAEMEDGSLHELLLADIRDVFGERAQMPSADLVADLIAIEGRPWADGLGKNRDKPLTSNRLASMLKRFKITSGTIRVGDKTPKGYLAEHFAEVFESYLPPKSKEGVSETPQRHKADEMGTSDLFQTATPETDVADRKCKKPNNDGHCGGVALAKGVTGEKTHVRTAKVKSDDLPYTGPPVDVPDPGPEDLDEHGAPRAAHAQPSHGEPGLSARRCVHCGEPERPGEPVQDVWVGDEGRAFPLHRRCEDEWLKEG